MAAFYTIDYLRARCVIDEKGCWIWQGAKDKGYRHGYGLVGPNQTGTTKVHRVMYILHFGTVSRDFEMDHLCRNRSCCNPDHLEPVTHLENMRRGIGNNSLKTHCPRGHEYTPENTLVSGEARYCRTCKRMPRGSRSAESSLPIDILSMFKE